MTKYHLRVPAYIYLRSDGPYPKTVPSDEKHTLQQVEHYWIGQTKFWADGMCQETCRDLSHTGSGLSSVAHIAETSRIQGNNLYHGEVGNRLYHALELHSQLEMHGNQNDWLCGGHIKGGLPPGQFTLPPVLAQRLPSPRAPRFPLTNNSSDITSNRSGL